MPVTENMLRPYRRAGAEVRDLLANFLADKGIKGDVHGPRIKDLPEIEKKMTEVGRPFEQIYDALGLRVIVHYLDEVYAVADFICHCESLMKKDRNGTMQARLADPEIFAEAHFEDYIKHPRGPTAYRTLQMVVYKETYVDAATQVVPLEIQIRTYLMHAWEEKDWRIVYKPPDGVQIPPSLIGEFYYISKLLFRVDEDFIDMRNRVDRIKREVSEQGKSGFICP